MGKILKYAVKHELCKANRYKMNKYRNYSKNHINIILQMKKIKFCTVF